MHALDYANMQMSQMEQKVHESKEKDKTLSKGMKYVLLSFQQTHHLFIPPTLSTTMFVSTVRLIYFTAMNMCGWGIEMQVRPN